MQILHWVKKGRPFNGARLVATLCVGLALQIVAAPVVAFPQLGHYFYGQVTLDGLAAPEGTVVVARVGDLEYRTTTDAQGRYGYSPKTLRVAADDPQTPAKEGASPGEFIDFYIGGVNTWIYYPFENGGVTQLDLSEHPYQVACPIVACSTVELR